MTGQRALLLGLTALGAAGMCLAIVEAVVLHFYFLPLCAAPLCLVLVRAWKSPDHWASPDPDQSKPPEA